MESFTSRIARIISANLNKGVEFFENQSADAVLAEAIREVEDVMADVRHELGKKIGERHHYSKKLAELNNEYEKLTSQSGLAIKEDREDLAKAAITKMLSIEAQLPVMEQSIIECQEMEKELNSHILALNAKKGELEEDYNQFVARTKSAGSEGETGGQSIAGHDPAAAIDTRVEKAESVFDRVYVKSLGVDRGQTSVTVDDAKKLAELQKLERDNRINERLHQLKAQLDSQA